MWKQIFKAAAIAGSLDISAASIQAYVTNKVTPDTLLRYIASGLFGKEAFSGGIAYVLIGLAVHFLIAFSCTVTYFFAYPKIKLLRISVLLSSFFVALVAWIITTRLIIPLSKIQQPPFNLVKAIIAISILYFCVGLPIAFITKSYYTTRKVIN